MNSKRAGLTRLRLWRVSGVVALASCFPFTVCRSPLSAQVPAVAPDHGLKLAHTYSIVAYDSSTGDLGVAVQSKFPNVGGIVP